MLRSTYSPLTMRRDEYQAKFGLLLFLVSLSMFFVASLVAYGIIRFASEAPALPITDFPASLVASTFSMFGVSLALHWSVLSVRRERQRVFRRYLGAAVAFSLLFLVFQTHGLHALLLQHGESLASGSNKQFGLMFFLVLVHALHVVGGISVLAGVVLTARRGGYDHEKHWGVDLCALYWHFLDIVWIIMLATFLVTR